MDRTTTIATIRPSAWIGAYILAAFVWIYYSYLGNLDGLVEPAGDMVVGRDFVNIWTAGRALLDGRLDVILDPERWHAFQRATFGPDFGWHNWSYPPQNLLIAPLLGALPYPLALTLWVGAGIAAFLTAALAGLERRVQILGALVLVPAVVVNVFFGQNGLFTGALAIGAIRLLDRRPVLSGVLMGLLTLKPHLGILLPVIVLLGRRWTTFAAAAGTALGLAAASLPIGGIEAWRAWIVETMPYQRMLAETSEPVFYAMMMPSALVFVRQLGGPLALGYGIYAAVAVAALALFLRVVRSGDNERTALAAVMATPLMLPYVFMYDLPAFAAAALLWVLADARAGRTAPTGAAVAFAAPLLVFVIALLAADLTQLPLQLGSFLLLGCFAAFGLSLPGRVLSAGVQPRPA